MKAAFGLGTAKVPQYAMQQKGYEGATKMPNKKNADFFTGNVAPIRGELVRAFTLALLLVLLWCISYNRWNVESWRTPLAYLSDPEKGDVLFSDAWVKAARDGHVSPLFFTNIPELGAPFVANWDDFPTTEKLLVIFTGLLAKVIGIFAALNFTFMAGHVLAALAFYAACRLLNCAWSWAFAGALVFAFARYAFAQGIHHFTVAYYWHVPLCLVVCRWILSGEGIGFRDRRFVFALAVAFVTGMQNVYYTNLFAQFVLFGGLVQAWRRGWRAALPAAAVIGTAATAFLLMNLNTFFYHFVHGPNPGAVDRAYKWMEMYGLKIVDLVVPPPEHRLPLFAEWGAQHLKEIILPPGEQPPTGYIGLAGLAALAWLAVVSFRKLVKEPGAKLPLETWQILWILLYAGIGGLNCVVGSLGFMLFRATTRYSIFILCIVLMAAAKRLSEMKFKSPYASHGLALIAAALALWDQLPPQVSTEEIEKTAKAVASDRHFTERMEQQLPPNAMVFQIPIMEFPESPAPGVGSYDHFRPYLYSHRLRFSFGSDKGRPREKWQQQLAGLSLGEVISRLESFGFSAIYVNRNGFSDKGEGLVKAFKEAGRGDMIESEKGDLLCVFLKPSQYPILPATPGETPVQPALPGMPGMP